MRSRAVFGRPVLVGGASLAAVAAAALIGVSGAGAASSGDARVVLKNIAFTKATVRIHRGARVTWSWQDPYTDHNIHSRGTPRFKGASARQTGTYTVRFTKPGTYRYECTLHPRMYGTVIVK